MISQGPRGLGICVVLAAFQNLTSSSEVNPTVLSDIKRNKRSEYAQSKNHKN